LKRPAWAVVPAKSLRRGKSRLAPLLGEAERAMLARALLDHVLDVLRACDLDGVLVATDGEDVASVARARGASVLLDDGPGSLARVVDRALAETEARGAAAAVVLMADLPRLQPADVVAVLRELADHDLAIVRDHQGSHTNALALSPPGAIRTRFGRDGSFEAHLDAARAAGLRVAVVDNARIALDVDVPADLRPWPEEAGSGSAGPS
jgi:2-phospho-L-lactate guanylyltransferase